MYPHEPERVPALIEMQRAQYAYAPPLAYPADEPEETRLPLSQYLWILRRYRWRILAFCAVCVAVTLAVVPNPAPDHYNGLEVSDDGWVTGGRLKGDAVGTWHFFGVQVVNREVFADLPDNVPAETIHGAYRALMGLKRGGLRAERMETPFLDVGTPRDYLEASLRLAHEQHWASAIDAGPGAVDRHGGAVPPYRETRDYVERIGALASEEALAPAVQVPRIYRTIEIVDGRPVPRFTDRKPDAPFEVVGP